MHEQTEASDPNRAERATVDADALRETTAGILLGEVRSGHVVEVP